MAPEFKVRIEALHEEGLSTWVLAVDPVGERLLIVHDDDKTLHWYPMKECAFVGIASPDVPRPVVAVQPKQQGPQLVTPETVPLNRAERRRNGAQ